MNMQKIVDTSSDSQMQNHLYSERKARPMKIFALSILLFTLLISTASAELTSITLRWDPNTEQDLLGYKIWRKTGINEEWWSLQRPTTLTLASTFYADGSVHSTRTLLVSMDILGKPITQAMFVDDDCIVGQVYYYKVTAYDTSLNESVFSETMGKRVRDKTPPTAPTNLFFIINSLFSFVIINQ